MPKRQVHFTPRQKAAQIRNFNKMRLTAAEKTLRNVSDSPSIDPLTRKQLYDLGVKLGLILSKWDADYMTDMSDSMIKAINLAGY
jgi:hypothetical protein